VPFDGPIPFSEDSAASRIITLTVKVLSKCYLFRLLFVNVLLYSVPLALLKTKLITSPNVLLFLLSANTPPISWDFNLVALNMLPSLVISKPKLKLLKENPRKICHASYKL
jgi:hypothetical protein